MPVPCQTCTDGILTIEDRGIRCRQCVLRNVKVPVFVKASATIAGVKPDEMPDFDASSAGRRCDAYQHELYLTALRNLKLVAREVAFDLKHITNEGDAVSLDVEGIAGALITLNDALYSLDIATQEVDYHLGYDCMFLQPGV